MSIRQTGIWKFFSSVKLAIWLLSVIAFLSLIGTFIPQNETPEFYIDKFGHTGYGVLSATGLTGIYSSWWFVLCLTLFSLNLAVCLLNRFPFKRRSIGTVISHFSILVILLGALIGMSFGQKGFIKIHEAEEVCCFTAKDGRRIDMGFSIKLDKFIYDEYIDPKERLLIYPAQDSHAEHEKVERPIAEIPTGIGIESEIADTGYRIKVLRYIPDFAIDITTKVAASRSAQPNNPAIEVRLTDKAGQVSAFWVFARFPDIHQKMGANFRFVYKWIGRRPKDFVSKVTVLKGDKEVISKNIRVNDPLDFGGYKFFQSSYDTDTLSWSGLQVVRDPGVGVVYAGFILLIVGFTIIFYIDPVIQSLPAGRQGDKR